jgi:hypothetical protein
VANRQQVGKVQNSRRIGILKANDASVFKWHQQLSSDRFGLSIQDPLGTKRFLSPLRSDASYNKMTVKAPTAVTFHYAGSDFN